MEETSVRAQGEIRQQTKHQELWRKTGMRECSDFTMTKWRLALNALGITQGETHQGGKIREEGKEEEIKPGREENWPSK